VIVRKLTTGLTKPYIYKGTVSFVGLCPPPTITIDLKVQEPVDGGGVIKLAAEEADFENGGGSDTIELELVDGIATTFYAYGETESKNMDDVTIKAIYQENSFPMVLGTTNVTVLWVELDVNTGNVHQKNTCRYRFIQQSPEKTDKLGKKMWTHNRPQGLVDYYSYCYEVQGTVKPGNFTGDLELLRDADVKAHIDSPLLLQNPPFQNPRAIPAPNQKNFGGNPGESANDTSDSDWLDLTSRPLIFDIDCPTPGVDPNVYVNNITNMFRDQGFPVNGISFKVVCTFKFREFATFGGTRCSDVKEFQTQFTFERNNNGAVMVDGQNWP